MDKGYNSEEIHRLIRETLRSQALIPIRRRKRKRIAGYYRRKMMEQFDQDHYHQRNRVETVFSVLKRKFGEVLKARKYRLQSKEIKIKVILSNLSRIMIFLSLFLWSLWISTKPDILRPSEALFIYEILFGYLFV
jgi:hypothetical protein